MFKTILSVLMISISFTLFAQIKLPAISPRVEITQDIGLTKLSLSYSRPSLKNRTLLGENAILMAGEKWRLGANATTSLEITKDVNINGQILNKGKYAILCTPSLLNWEFHFYEFDKGSYTKFLEQKPILETSIPVEKSKDSYESLNIFFENIDLESAFLVVRWSDYKVRIPIQLNEHEQIMNNINKVLSGPSDFSYYRAALYLHERNQDLPLALKYVRKATEGKAPMFFQVYREALILRDLNQKEEAIRVAQRSKEMCLDAGNPELARLSQKIIDDMSR